MWRRRQAARPLQARKQERDVSNIEDIADRTAAGIALAYRSGEANPVELTECVLERIAKAKGDNIFITVSATRARAEAKKAQGRYEVGAPLSPLDGVPVSIKELVRVQVPELAFDRKLRLVYRREGTLSHAAEALLTVVEAQTALRRGRFAFAAER